MSIYVIREKHTNSWLESLTLPMNFSIELNDAIIYKDQTVCKTAVNSLNSALDRMLMYVNGKAYSAHDRVAFLLKNFKVDRVEDLPFSASEALPKVKDYTFLVPEFEIVEIELKVKSICGS